MSRNLRATAALLSGVSLLAGCETAPNIAPSAPQRRPVAYQPLPIPTPAPAPVPSPPASPDAASDTSSSNSLVDTGLTLLPVAAAVAVPLAMGAKKPSTGKTAFGPPPAPSPAPSEPAVPPVAATAATEERGLAGLMARLRANPAIKAVGLEGGEAAAAEGSGLLGMALLRSVAVPLIAAGVLYEIMKK